jgi:hypothetical protein
MGRKLLRIIGFLVYGYNESYTLEGGSVIIST